MTSFADTDVAIVGMAAHLPGAQDIDAYWQMLRDGRRAIRRLSRDELLAAGEDPALIDRPDYVPFAAPLDGFTRFDPDFFGFSPKDAAILDPQHRQFLEVCWQALENAAHAGERGGRVGVYAGCGTGTYYHANLLTNRDLVRDVGLFLLRHTGNDKDFLSTRVSHVFDLRGPSVNVQTACSTSLVAVHLAVQALQSGEVDMALAGGVTIELPHNRGYLFKEGEILSPDGECHAFDHRAQGTVFGSGAGCVVLRRLSDAQRDGDHIWAVIKGSAINNDGAQKANYLAPGVEGQAACIAEALAMADVAPETVGYIECHGTGTYLGDPIEVAALTQGYAGAPRGSCRLGSVKTNIGHLDTAAGVAGLIKAALALYHREIPASLGFEAPNPAIDFDTSPFTVADRLIPWDSPHPRRAAVNSLGVGGTNAHVILQEAPARPASVPSDWPFQIVALSARSKPALDDTARDLAAHLRANPDLALDDVAWTLKQGRAAFDRRRVLVATDATDAADQITRDDPRRVFTHTALDAPDVVFLFPGGGAQYAGMARDLYETEPVFAEWMDRGLAHLQPKLDYDLRALWLPEPGALAAADQALLRPSVQLPLIMITEYALAQMFMAWGVEPAALAGHSMGENTAAALAGVMSFEDCIDLVHLRGQLFDTVPRGGMLSVPLSEPALAPYLGDLDIASLNAPDLTVVSGPDAALDALAARLAEQGIETQRVRIDIAAHSRMLEPILGRFRAHLAGMRLSAPRIPVISNRTGQPLTAEQATSPDYWTQHLRGTVRFADCVSALAERPNRIYLEMGPGKALSSLTRQHGAVPGQQVLSVLRHPDEGIADDAHHLLVLARLWALGADFDWTQIWGEAARARLPLPGYGFQRADYFIAPGRVQDSAADTAPARIADLADWGSKLSWVPAESGIEFDIETDLTTAPRESWLVFTDGAGVAAPVIARLRAAGHAVCAVTAGDVFARRGMDYTLSPEHGRADYDALVADMLAQGRAPTRIAHFWLCDDRVRPGSSPFQRNLEQGFYSLTFLVQAMAAEGLSGLPATVFTTGAARLRGEPMPAPEKALIAGPARVMGREWPGASARVLDLPPGGDTLAALEEMLAPPADTTALWRGRRYQARLRPVPLTTPADLPQGAVWVITGGFGGIGLTVAEDLIRRTGARIALIARTPLPDAADWPAILRDPADPRAARIAALQHLQSLGQVMVCAADVCNIDQMRAALDAVRARFGAPWGLIHAAGHIDDAPLLAKTTASIESVLAPKVHGLRVIDQVLPDGALGMMVLFSSTSTLTAPAGQVDYVAANEYLAAFARARAGGKTRVLALHWGIWSQVGMAADAMAQRTGTARSLPAGVALLDRMGLDAQGNRRFTATLTQDQWLLNEHRTKDGRAVVPGTGIVELAAQALRAQGETGAFELRDLVFFRAVQVDDPREIRVTLERTEGGYDFALRSAVTVAGRAGFVLNATARIDLGHVAPAPALDIAGAMARCGDVTEGHGMPTAQEAHLAFGPRWRVLNRRALGNAEGVAHLALPAAYTAEIADYTLHPALMDIATGWAMDLIPGYAGRALWVPVRYPRLTVHRPLPAQIISHVRLAPAEPGFAAFDVTLAAPDGTVCAVARGFTVKRLDTGLVAAPIAPSEVESDTARDLSGAEARLARNLALGITPGDGAEGFARALAVDGPQVIVSSLPLPALIAEAAARDTAPEGQKFDRPGLDSAFVAPRTDIERVLAGFWEDLLGIQGIGVDDNFFDLGGHSLIAVRLFARVKKAFSVDFPLSVLFEAPTIARVAAMIADRTGATDSPDTPARPQRRFEFLVPMHQGEPGARTPFFLVAGMFGNVLNLRNMAMLLGADRPFYGLQARGLLGDVPPHARLDQAARDYIAELRQVQPHGPYLLGGFSGGGLTALEMAHQLRAAGEQVALLTLLDTPLPLRPGLSRTDKALIKLTELARKGPGYITEWRQARRDWAAEQARMAAEAAAEWAQPGGFHNRAIESAFRAALPHVDLRRYDAPVALFRPPLDRHWRVSGGRWVSAAREYVSPDNDWSAWMPDLTIHEVPGDHDSMVLEPNVRVLAAKLRELIAGAGL